MLAFACYNKNMNNSQNHKYQILREIIEIMEESEGERERGR